jgi:hypothetical protein
VKIVFLAGCAALALMLLFATRMDRGSRDAWLWRGGESDSLRNAVVRPDGTFRKSSKAVWLASLLIFALIVWFLPEPR